MTTTRGPAGSRPLRASDTELGIPVALGLVALCVVASIAGGVSGVEPVGSRTFDILWSAVFSVVVVLAASRSRRMPTSIMAGIAGVIGIGGGPTGLVFGILSLSGALYTAFSDQRRRLVGGAIGLAASQALLRGPSYGFTGLPTLVAFVAVAPVLVSAWRIARSRERRIARWVLIGLGALVLIGAATAGAAAYGSRRSLDNAADQATAALDLLREGDTEAAADAFSKAQYQFEKASSELDGPLGLVGRAVPGVAQNLEALRRVSAAGENLGFTASQAATRADWGSLTAANGTVDLARVTDMQEPVAESAAALDAALATVADVRSPWLAPPLDGQLDRLDDKLSDAASEASIAAEALAVAPTMLGQDRITRYFVAFATPGESRNAGGFAGSFAIVEAEGGNLRVTRTGTTMTGLEPAAGDAYDLQLTDEWRTIYSGYSVENFPGNLTASPDWPTDAAVAAQIYAQSEGGAPIDGVVYADPAALAALLELTGPVEVPGVPEPLTADNVEQYLLVDQYIQYQDENQERSEVLGDVARAVFDALTSQPLPGVRTMTDVLGPAVSAQHLRLTMVSDQSAASFLDRVGLSGAFGATADTDLLSLRSANLLPSKIDAYLRRDVAAMVDIDPSTGEITTTVEVTLTNDAPSAGLPSYLIGTGRQAPQGTNRDLLTLYSPLALDSVEVDGVAAGAQSHEELGLNSYGVPIDIPAGQQVKVTYRLTGPPPTELAESGLYRLLVVPQPLAQADRWTVTVTSGGRELVSEVAELNGTLKINALVADGG